jgi:hypothetical protein
VTGLAGRIARGAFALDEIGTPGTPGKAGGARRGGSFYGRVFAIAFLIGCALAGSLLLFAVLGERGCRAPALERPLGSASAAVTHGAGASAPIAGIPVRPTGELR